ncbi:MAG TPA: hypothetical protein VG318_10065 [Actinomycetota bacterium]|nr:hypothetical protein [Actinomycetota bacterium]
MTRALVCIALVVLSGCTANGDGVEELDAALRRERAALRDAQQDLGRAKARIQSMEREARRPPPPPAPGRYVDLWGGGPTMHGPFLALPRFGTFKWRCSVRNHYFRIVYANAGATATVEYDTPGPGKHVTLHSGGTVGATVRAGQPVTWRLTHRHPPGFIRAHVSVTPAVSKHDNCFLADVQVREAGRPYD